jgi:hypothetical protein
MKRFALLFLVTLACLAAALPVVAAQPSQVSVSDYGAKGDGVTDDTAAFNAAFAALPKGGGTVSVPVGNYMIKTHISVPSSVTLEGVWSIPTAFSQMKGSTLLAVEGEGSETGPAFITLGVNATIKGLTVYYPNQYAEKVAAYPWCVACAGGDNASIIDCLLVNPYQGVDFGTNASGRHYIRGLYGQPLRRGIFIDKCYDVGRIENVHFWPFWQWDEKSGIRDWMWKNSEAFIFARADWEYVLNTFVFGYKVGYHFIASKDGPCNGNFLGIGADASNIAVLVENTQGAGLLITNGEFVAFAEDKPCEVVVTDTNKGVVQFSNCAYWGPADQIARIAGEGTVSFTGCNFNDWNRKKNKTPAIELYGGNLIVNGCNFNGAGPQVALMGKASSAIVMGNRMGGPMGITNSAKADLQVGLNVFDKGPQHPKEEAGAVVVDDNDGPPSVRFYGKWELAMDSSVGYFEGTHWAYNGKGEAKAVFAPNVPKAGLYRAFAWFGPNVGDSHASNAPVTITTSGKSVTKLIDLRSTKGEWVDLGNYKFAAGRKATITFSNNADRNVLADAVKLVPAGIERFLIDTTLTPAGVKAFKQNRK